MNKPHLQEAALNEAIQMKDLVIESFHDTYPNLTLKTTFLLKWLSDRCQAATLILKIDDDVYVNTDNFWPVLQRAKRVADTQMSYSGPRGGHQSRARRGTLIGLVVTKARVVRDPASKWYLSKLEYKDNVHPSYLNGPAYIFSGDILKSLYSCTLRTPFIPIEDVFLTGLCATKALRLRLTDMKV